MKTKITMLILLLFFTLSSAKTLTNKDLESDLRYYYKISKEKLLSANDKLFILNKLYEKYKNTNVDITALKKEIEKVEKEKQKLTTQQEIKTTTVPTETERYKISPGDILYIKVLPAEELSTEVVVTPDGKILLPLVGTVEVEGLTIKELERNLEKLFSVYITQPKVSIIIKYFSKKQVFIIGEVKNPGSYPYREGIRLFELISEAGGVTQYGGTKNVKIYRDESGKKTTINVNLEEIISDVSKDVVLRPGDVIEVPRQPKNVSVVGEVVYPGEYSWYEGLDIVKAISLARGYTATAKLSSVKVHRINSQGKKEVIDVNVAKILEGKTENFLLQPGDVVYIPKKPLVGGQWFVNTVLPWLSLIMSVLVLIAYVSK